MTVIATKPNAALPVAPGGEATYDLTVRNTGSVVDAFTVEPLGEAAPWMAVEPPVLPLFPGAEGIVQLRFQPPRRATTRAGEVPWAARVSSREEPLNTWVEEGLLEVAPFCEVSAEIAPLTTRARGKRRGRHQLAIDNRGNTRTEIRLAGGDDEGNVAVELRPPTVVLQPGTAHIVAVRPRATKRIWRGPAKTHPYSVVVDHGDGEPQTVPATLLQETVIPAWLVKTVIALLVLALLLFALWAAVLKPTISDAARAAATDEAAAVAKKEAAAAAQKAAEQSAAQGQQGAQPSPPAVPKPPVKPPAKPPTASSPAPIDPLGNPVNFRIAATAGSPDVNLELSDKEIVSITDLFFQNPEGDAGRLEVFKNGRLIYTTRLNNWRDLDQHANAPYEFKPGDRVRLKVACENVKVPPAPAARPCTPALTLVGYSRKPAA